MARRAYEKRMSLEKTMGRRSFVLTSGAVAAGALAGGAQQVPKRESGVKLVDDDVGLKKRDNGVWGWSHEFHRDTSAPFQAGAVKVHWTYEMAAEFHVRTDTGAAPTKGVHRWFLLSFVATPRLTIRETHPETDGRLLLQWPMNAVSAAVLVEAGAKEIVVHEPIGHLRSRSQGIKLDLEMRIQKSKSEDGDRSGVSFWPAKPDLTGFNEDAALAELGRYVGVPRKKIFNQHPVGTTNNTNALSFILAMG